MSDDKIHYELQDNIAVFTLDDGKANTVDHTFIGEMHEALRRAKDEARAIVITGRPGRFSAGFDLKTMLAGAESAQGLVKTGADMLLAMYLHPQPLVIACSGHALAAGALMLLTGDTRLGIKGDFKIGLNEVAIGMRLPIFAMELARERLTKRAFNASTLQARIRKPKDAKKAGFLDRIVSSDKLMDEALAVAAALGELDPGAYAQTKELQRGGMVGYVRESLAEDIAKLMPPTPAQRS